MDPGPPAYLPLSISWDFGHSFGLGARAPIPRQGCVGKALRRWPPGREGVWCCQRTREVNVDSGTLQGQWDTALPVTSWKCLKLASLLLQILKTSKSLCPLHYEDEDEEDTQVRTALSSPCDPCGPAMRGPCLRPTSPGLGSWWGWTTGEGAAGTPVTGTVLARRASCPGAPASWTWSRWRAADRWAGPGGGAWGLGRTPHLFPAKARADFILIVDSVGSHSSETLPC